MSWLRLRFGAHGRDPAIDPGRPLHFLLSSSSALRYLARPCSAVARIAAPAAIDPAVRLGLAYPKGPLEGGDALGPRRVLAILEAMHDAYRDPRYRPSPWLSRRARLGVPLTTPEG